jgi:dienelactone hydrolase
MRILFIVIAALSIASCGGTVANQSNNGAGNGASSSPTPSVTPAESVTIDSPDGVKLVGSLFESSTPNSPGLLLLHQWESDRHSFDGFAKRMQSKGFVVLAIDGRGFGVSTKKADGSSVTAGRTDADVKAMLADVDAAVQFLKKQKNVDATKIGIVGASYGSSLAIIYAADHPDIGAIALLSPGLNYFGNMPTLPAVKKYGDRALYTVAAKDDVESAKAVEGLQVGTSKHGSMVLPAGTYHGTYLFEYREKPNAPPVVEDALESFFTKSMIINEQK